MKPIHRHLTLQVALLMLVCGMLAMAGAGLVTVLALDSLPPRLTLCPGSLVGVLVGLGLLSTLYERPVWRRRLGSGVIGAALAGLISNLPSPLAISWPPALAPWLTLPLGVSLLTGLVGLCLMTDPRGRGHRLWSATGLVLIICGALSLTAQMPGADTLAWPGESRFASAVAGIYALLLGLALLLLGRRHSLGPALGKRARSVAVLGVVAGALAGYTLAWQQYTTTLQHGELLLDSLQANMASTLENHQQLMWRMAERWSVLGGLPAAAMREREVESYLRDTPDLLGIALIGGETPRLRWAALRHSQMRGWLEAQVATRATPTARQARWHFPDPERPALALFSMPLAGTEGAWLLSVHDLSVLLEPAAGTLPPAFNLHIERDARRLHELAHGAHRHGEGPEAMVALGQRRVPLPGRAPLELILYMAPVPLAFSPLLPLGAGMTVLVLSFLLALSLGLVAHGRARERQLAATQERYRSLFTHHPDGVYEFDLAGHFVHGNAALTRITGHPLSSLIDRHFNEFIEEGARAATQAGFTAAAAGHGQHYETRGIHASGHSYALEVTNLPIVVDERVVGVYGICRDVTPRKRHEEQLRLLKRAIEASPNGIIIADAQQPDLPVVYVNETFCTLTGYTKEEALGRNCRFLQGNETDPEAKAKIRAAFAARQDVQVILRNYRKDGTPFWNQLFIGPVLDASGQCTHMIGIQQDITQHREYEARLSYQETHDLLTSLPNRRHFESRLEHEYRRGQPPRERVMLYIDLDGFKLINDGLGHQVGDRLLVAVAERLRALVRPGDLLARLGGDEFAIALCHLDEPSDATGVAERVLKRLEAPFEIDHQQLHISASVGLASSQHHAGSVQELIQHADLAMQGAKAQGRNTWQWHGGGSVLEVGEHVALRRELQDAIHTDQFEVYYQPIVETATGQVRSVEALVRWHHPTRGLVSPGRFIPLAEKTGQIVAIGQWVLQRACRDMAALQTAGDNALPVAVNISPLQFRRAGFLEHVRAVLEETGLTPSRLELEVTEGMLMSGTERAIELLAELRALGVRVAIDDFGTGFSSLSYLRQLPINKIKLDRSFIHDLTTNRDNAAIVQGIITMAHHLNLEVVAEGVETRELQEDLMRRHCDLLQGFLFAKPLPLQALARLPERLPAPA